MCQRSHPSAPLASLFPARNLHVYGRQHRPIWRLPECKYRLLVGDEIRYRLSSGDAFFAMTTNVMPGMPASSGASDFWLDAGGASHGLDESRTSTCRLENFSRLTQLACRTAIEWLRLYIIHQCLLACLIYRFCCCSDLP